MTSQVKFVLEIASAGGCEAQKPSCIGDLPCRAIADTNRDYFSTKAESETRSALRAVVFAGPTRGEKKILLLRICDAADSQGVATVSLRDLSAELGQFTSLTRRLVSKLIHHGDLKPLDRRYGNRTFRVTPRRQAGGASV